MASYDRITPRGGGLRLQTVNVPSMPKPPKWKQTRYVGIKKKPKQSEQKEVDISEWDDLPAGLKEANREYDYRNSPQKQLEDELAREELQRVQNRRYNLAYGRDPEQLWERGLQRQDEDLERKAAFRQDLFNGAKLSKHLQNLKFGDDGFARLSDEGAGVLPSVLPDINIRKSGGDETAPGEPLEFYIKKGDKDKNLEFYQIDAETGKKVRVMNKGYPVALSTDLAKQLGNLDKILQKQELGIDEEAERKRTEERRAEENKQIMKLFSKQKKNQDETYKYEPEKKQTDAEIMEWATNTVRELYSGLPTLEPGPGPAPAPAASETERDRTAVPEVPAPEGTVDPALEEAKEAISSGKARQPIIDWLLRNGFTQQQIDEYGI